MKQQELELILKEYQTPAYVFDLDALARRAQRILACLKKAGIDLCYAMKANPFLTGALEPLADRFEVCSPGEFRICEKEGIPMERLVISGVNKERKDISRMIEQYQGRGIFTVESMQQFRLLSECAREAKVKLNLLVRISSGNQFGVDYELAKQMFGERKSYPELTLRGIQYYSGTQKKKLPALEQELKMLDRFCREVQEELGAAVSELEYGPGLFVPYFQSEPEEHLEELLEELAGLIGRMDFSGKVTLEMGRFLAAECGSYLTRIVDRKENGGQIYGIVDGGIHQLNYYGQTMAMKLPFIQHIPAEKSRAVALDTEDPAQTRRHGKADGADLSEPVGAQQEGALTEADLSEPAGAQQEGALTEREEKWNICGSLCTAADVIVKQYPLTDAKEGDVLVFERTGAYSVTEGISLFLSRDLPKVLFYSQKEGIRLVRDRQETAGINSAARYTREPNDLPADSGFFR
ncbi:MAG: diaminopimelate decarboxylase [Lachnospiraceae bacterium]|nr:diaminopimelate decarboxylase [Lachnospiraceae bacterium]